jgi:hypothetical protein
MHYKYIILAGTCDTSYFVLTAELCNVAVVEMSQIMSAIATYL